MWYTVSSTNLQSYLFDKDSSKCLSTQYKPVTTLIFLGQITEQRLKFRISASWSQPWPPGKMFNYFVTQVALLEMAKTTSNVIGIFKVPQNQSLQSSISEQMPMKWLSTESPGSTFPCPEQRTLGTGRTYWICLERTKRRSATTSGESVERIKPDFLGNAQLIGKRHRHKWDMENFSYVPVLYCYFTMKVVKNVQSMNTEIIRLRLDKAWKNQT